MAKVSEVYSGQFVTASELPPGRRVAAHIFSAEAEAIGQDQQPKLVLSLVSTDGRAWPRRVVLNKTNSVILAAAYGDDTAGWAGKTIEVWSENVMFQGRMVPGIKVAPSLAAPAASGGNGAGVPVRPGGVVYPLPTPAATKPAAPAPIPADLDDEIPF